MYDWKAYQQILQKKHSDCKDCIVLRALKRYYENRFKLSVQQKIYYEKNREKILLQKQNNRCIFSETYIVFYWIKKQIKSNGSKFKRHFNKLLREPLKSL